ncbi:uncharacterized protein LOC124539658 [Vanessa cardui]|uniref:uncharacterized protein LOC124539658 n=1 Tax=Vanessa cardui TaxID=171605 RepID=UPI001F1346FB|nr:uncharacterized protein LOC124539658 [Vanessa cardui]
MSTLSTPINSLNRDNLIVLIRNNVLNNSIEFASDCDAMETDSPVRKPTSLKPIIKKLFHSPISPRSPERPLRSKVDRNRKRKRKEILLPGSEESITLGYVKETEKNKDSYSPDSCKGMRKRMLISLFHNKEYSMDLGD